MSISSPQDYATNRLRDYYRFNDYSLNYTFEPDNGSLEWGYTTKDNIYRHLSTTEAEASMSDIDENDGITILHSISSYENPSNVEYNKKKVLESKLAIQFTIKSEEVSTQNWEKLLSGIEKTKNILETDFGITTEPIRVSTKSVCLISDRVFKTDLSDIHNRVQSVVNPYKVMKVMGNLRSQSYISRDRLHRELTDYLQEIYTDYKDRVKNNLGSTKLLNVEDALSKEDKLTQKQKDFITSLSDELQEKHDGIGKQKSYQFIKGFTQMKATEKIDNTVVLDSSFNRRKVAEQYIDTFLQSWLVDRNTIEVDVLDKHSLIPPVGSVSGTGLFYVHTLSSYDIEQEPLIPLNNTIEYFGDNTISIKLHKRSLDIVESLNDSDSECSIKQTTSPQKVPESEALLLLSESLADIVPDSI